MERAMPGPIERIDVDAGSLGAVGAKLTAGVAVAREINKHHQRLAAHAAHCGHPDAAAGISRFLDAWGYGCGCLAGDAEAIGAAMTEAEGLYRSDESLISAAAGVDV
jgi:hypothetical protein